MKCPRCGKEIGGYAQMGSQAYQRVSQGRCPNCGRGMPSGYQVGFAAPRQASKTYSQQDYKEEIAGSGLRSVTVLAAMVLVILSIWKDGRPGGCSLGWTITLTVLAVLVCGGLSLYYGTFCSGLTSPPDNRIREDLMPQNGMGGVVIVGCFFVSLIMLGFSVPVRGSIVRLLLYLPLILLYLFAGPMGRKAQKRQGAAEEEKQNKQLHDLIELIIKYPELSCAGCSRRFDRLKPRQIVYCPDCPTILCPDCAGRHDARHKKLALDYKKLTELM